MGRAVKLLVILLGAILVFVASFWFGWRVLVSVLPPELDLDQRRAAVAGFAAVVAGATVTLGALWARRDKDSRVDAPVGQSMSRTRIKGGGPNSLTFGQVGRDFDAGRDRD